MQAPRQAGGWQVPSALTRHFGHMQHRTAYYLTLSNLMGAATGLLFWVFLARLGGIDVATIGVGYTVIALGAAVGVLAKGGLDTALLQKVPGAARSHGIGLLLFAMSLGTAVAIALTFVAALSLHLLGVLQEVTPLAWLLVACTAILLVGSWLQDAYFVALGRARYCFERNAVLSAGRLLLPFPVIALAVVHPVPLTWALALGLSILVAATRARRIPAREGRAVPRREFLAVATRNLTGSAAEFLPGLLLTPVVLLMEGAETAAYFGMAWTAAALLFQTSSAIGRSALAQMIHKGPTGTHAVIRRALVQQLWIIGPLALVAALFAPQLLSIFGPGYASEGAPVLVILAASAVLVAPVAVYLAVLRSRERGTALVVFPAALIALLVLCIPPLQAQYGATGVALAWFAANAPFALFASWRLVRETREVTPLAEPLSFAHPSHVE